MSDIPPIDSRANVIIPRTRRPDEPAGGSTTTPVDRVDISETGQILATLDHADGIRAEKVAAIREAIQNGTYETSDKIDYTVSRLLAALRA